MAHKVFTDPHFTHNAVDLSADVLGMALDYEADEVDDAAGADTTHIMLPDTLLDYTLTVELAQDFRASGPDVTLFPDVGKSRTIVIRDDKSAGVSATNPNYTGSMILKSYPPFTGVKVGEKNVTTIVYRPGGALSRATS